MILVFGFLDLKIDLFFHDSIWAHWKQKCNDVQKCISGLVHTGNLSSLATDQLTNYCILMNIKGQFWQWWIVSIIIRHQSYFVFSYKLLAATTLRSMKTFTMKKRIIFLTLKCCTRVELAGKIKDSCTWQLANLNFPRFLVHGCLIFKAYFQSNQVTIPSF